MVIQWGAPDATLGLRAALRTSPDSRIGESDVRTWPVTTPEAEDCLITVVVNYCADDYPNTLPEDKLLRVQVTDEHDVKHVVDYNLLLHPPIADDMLDLWTQHAEDALHRFNAARTGNAWPSPTGLDIFDAINNLPIVEGGLAACLTAAGLQ